MIGLHNMLSAAKKPLFLYRIILLMTENLLLKKSNIIFQILIWQIFFCAKVYAAQHCDLSIMYFRCYFIICRTTLFHSVSEKENSLK